VRYFFYANSPGKTTAVVVDEGSEFVTLFPPERINNCSTRKGDWLDYYRGLDEESRKTTMFEICKNQFRKFVETGVTPDCHDSYFVAQRIKAGKPMP
jgi:hypothetical protein